MKKRTTSLLLSIFLAILVLVPTTLIQTAFADDALTAVRFDETGNYSIVAKGVGLYETTSGDIVIDVPGSSVIAAYLYWAGFSSDPPGGDDSVSFDGTTITADDYYGPDYWWGDNYHYVYVADVTSYVNLGPDTYTVADVAFEHNYGAGLLVVYEDPSLPEARVTILDGLDSFWFDWEDPRGPNSEVTSIDFDPVMDSREVELILFVGGVQHDDRPNAVWVESGIEDNDNLIDTPSGPSGAGSYPLEANEGAEWDTYSDIYTIPAEDDWFGIQIESIEGYGTGDNYGRGTSALLTTAGFVLPTETPPPTGVDTPGYWKNHPEAWPVDEITIGGVTYTKAEAIALMWARSSGDKTYSMFSHLVAAKLNVAMGNPDGCVEATIAAADLWMEDHPPGSGVSGSDAAWQSTGEALKDTLDDYNNGRLCAPKRD